jgi:BirA family biotin operon repressor/biotin-[acetyl-CoA-carboxylase] ligase
MDDGLEALRSWRGRALAGVELLDEVDSTNAEALRRTDRGERADGRLLLARRQSAGHGSRGRTWSSPPGRSLALTAWLPWPEARPITLATWLGVVAVIDAVAALGLAASIKWPNDALIAGRKVAGVLAEVRAGPPSVVALGIGLNVLQSEEELPRDAPTPPTSLQLEGAHCSLLDAATALLDALDRRVAQLTADPAAIRDTFEHHLALTGRAVIATLPGASWFATLARLDLDGTLLLAPAPAAPPPPAGATALPAPLRVNGGHVAALRAG